jgi:aminopeptidase N
VVVADFLDGMEYDGLYFLSRGFYNTFDGTPANYLAIIAVHETAHQWWFAQVGNDQALEPWLDEALCTYSERLFYERQYPELASWWLAYRVDFYQPSGPVGGTVYDYTGFRPYRDAVYLRGAQFLEALRQRVGEQAFSAFLQDYAIRMAGRSATAADFFSVLAEHSSAEINDLRQVFFQP